MYFFFKKANVMEGLGESMENLGRYKRLFWLLVCAQNHVISIHSPMTCGFGALKTSKGRCVLSIIYLPRDKDLGQNKNVYYNFKLITG